MEFITEMDAAIQSGLDEFNAWIEKRLQLDPHALEYSFWMKGGEQITLVNYLIQYHQNPLKDSDSQDSPRDLTPFIDSILNKLSDKNMGLPLHKALSEGKTQLALYLLAKHNFDVNKRDEEGRTLLSLALPTTNRQLLTEVLSRKPDVNAPTRLTESRILFQPLHQAILLNFAFGIISLIKSGADLANFIGVRKDTPLLLAARENKLRALEILLDASGIDKLDINAESIKLDKDKKRGENAIEALCMQLEQNENDKDLLRAVAMLLCRGSEPPRSNLLCQLLANKRQALLAEIDRYMDIRPELVDPFVTRCHVADSALHKLIYVDHSWGNSFRKLFGSPTQTALVIERLITRKYNSRMEGSGEPSIHPTVAIAHSNIEVPAYKLYAEFVRRYTEAYADQKISNPWSKMRWMIAEGQCNWEMVQEYAQKNPGTRTQIIYDDMCKSLPKMRVSVENENSPAVECS